MFWKYTSMLIISTIILHFLGTTFATERPIIGILTEELRPKTPDDAHSMIAASYVKAVEQSGARVVPIFVNRTDSYYRHIVHSVNGVLFPGGGVYFNTSRGFADAGKIIVDHAIKINLNGDNFPILGVCLGFELLLYLETNSYSILDECNSNNVALPLIFKNDFRRSQLYHKATPDTIEILSNLPVTYNHHQKCTTEQLMSQFNLTEKWRILTTSYDLDKKEFVSSIEHRSLPFAGIQFHPEKNAFEWNTTSKIVHTHKAVNSVRLFYDWLVMEARRNSHSFKNNKEESESLIYNYAPTYESGGYFEQVYYFN